MDYSVKNVAQHERLSPNYSSFGTAEKSQSYTRGSAADRVDFGRGSRLDETDALSIVLERLAYRMWSETATAREELGVPWDALATMSPPYSAGRIIDEGVKTYELWRTSHPELSGDAAKATFAQTLRNASANALDEARRILSTVKGLSPAVESRVAEISILVKDRVDLFVTASQAGDA